MSAPSVIVEGGIVESRLNPASAHTDVTVPSGEPWLHRMRRGETLRIVDLEGNQAVDTLFYNAADVTERYSVPHTLQAQQSLYLAAGRG